MDASGYVALSRQSGLLAQMDIIANNIANASTSGFRREGMVFSEYVKAAGAEPSLSIGYGNVRVVDQMQGGLVQTGGSFDFAIEGDGFFLIDTPQGQQLTRSGNFAPGPDGTLVTTDGYKVLDAGGSTIFVPPNARNVTVAQDGTLSVNGVPLSQIGLWKATDPLSLTHEAGTRFSSSGVEPVAGGRMMQGFVEDSNVDPLQEVASMIAVQRAYEMGQNFLDREDDRARNVIQTLGR
ncbi:MAG: flagellar hook-basal body complex protein [Alphaproteobacteria bacterium]